MAFDPTEFKSDYPQFASISDNRLKKIYNNEALVMSQKVVMCVPIETTDYWVEIVLAHILTIDDLMITGRVSQSTEGSVSGSFEMPVAFSNAWWNLSIYGQKCFQVINVAGGMIYFPSCDQNYPGQGYI